MRCHHHVPLAAPPHLAFGTLLFPPRTNPNPCSFSEAVFQPFSCSPLSHTLLAAVVPRAGSRLPLTLRRSPEGNKCVLLVFPFEEMMKPFLCSEILPVFRALAHTDIFMRWQNDHLWAHGCWLRPKLQVQDYHPGEYSCSKSSWHLGITCSLSRLETRFVWAR